MNVLVTGGAGFIGSSLVRSLAGDGHIVRVLDDFSTGRPENLDGVAGDLEVLEGDVRDPATVAKAVAGAEVVHHLAALPSVARSVADPRAAHEVNVDGTLTVLLEARDAGVGRLVYASSSSVYGNTPTLPKHEEMPVSPRSPYAAAKLAGEAYCRAFAGVYPLETVCLRFFNVFGPRQDPKSPYSGVISIFCDRLSREEPLDVFGDGEQTRDFVYVGDVVAAMLAAVGHEGGLFNVGTGIETTVNELYRLCAEVAGSDAEAEHAPARPGDLLRSFLDPSRAERELGWQPAVSLEDGLRQTWEWTTSARAAPR
jgi:nucleoside-diphosphate-sugar epimerase